MEQLDGGLSIMEWSTSLMQAAGKKCGVRKVLEVERKLDWQGTDGGLKGGVGKSWKMRGNWPGRV